MIIIYCNNYNKQILYEYNFFCAAVDIEHIERQYDTSDEDFELLGWKLTGPSGTITTWEATIKYNDVPFKTIYIFEY